MEIRRLTGEDAPEWWRLRLEALRANPEAFGSSPEEHEAVGLEEVRERLRADGDAFVLGAFDGDRLMGTAGFHREKGPKRRHKGGIWGVYVTSEARGKGVGRAIMQKLIERVRSIEGIEQILLAVAVTQTAARALYESLGFETFGREPRALKIGERFIDEDHMVLRIGQGEQASNKKAPSTFQSRTPRQPSPRTAKPRSGC